ncbi:hypothetical protein FZC33_01925 [Labrys sp. KNU-23]|uniref:hypothetical protein n=1 Tax=Labrys sp. KNU-23 TaxID=2789216 RepID=UPI0011F01686|nr:hypothetical protein [Labrys sp. KNU-23]QEN85042.1 hypothetical protein FZC33_01925 [Labrys sp. KNU-23]
MQERKQVTNEKAVIELSKSQRSSDSSNPEIDAAPSWNTQVKRAMNVLGLNESDVDDTVWIDPDLESIALL